MSLFSMRKATSRLKALAMPIAVNVYCLSSAWTCMTVFSTNDLFFLHFPLRSGFWNLTPMSSTLI